MWPIPVTLTATFAALAALTLPAAAMTYHPQHRVDGDYTITINGSNAYPESIVADNRYAHTGLWPAAPSCGHADRVIAPSPRQRRHRDLLPDRRTSPQPPAAGISQVSAEGIV
jgi:hypothetical protein